MKTPALLLYVMAFKKVNNQCYTTANGSSLVILEKFHCQIINSSTEFLVTSSR